MKVFAVHDEAGSIVGLAIPAEDVKEDEFGLVAEPGQYVSEIEVRDPGNRQPSELLRDLTLHYQVERSATVSRFTDKRASG